jgi:hypothetical protein
MCTDNQDGYHKTRRVPRPKLTQAASMFIGNKAKNDKKNIRGYP